MLTLSQSITSRFAKISQLVLTAVSASVISLAAVPSTSLAAGADGSYRVTGGSGSFTAGGETAKIPKSLFNDIAKNPAAGIVVKDQKLKINRKTTASLLESLAGDSGITIRPRVTGPSYLTFVPAGNRFAGETLQPIVTKFSGVEDGKKFSVTLKTYVSATVKGDSLTLVTRFTATDGADKLSGTITLLGRR